MRSMETAPSTTANRRPPLPAVACGTSCAQTPRMGGRFGDRPPGTTATGICRRSARSTVRGLGRWRGSRSCQRPRPRTALHKELAERRDRPRRARPSGSFGTSRATHGDGRGREPATRASVADHTSVRSIRAGGSSEPPMHRSWPARRRPGVHRQRGTMDELRPVKRGGSPVGPRGWARDPPSRQPPHFGAAGLRQGQVTAPGVARNRWQDWQAGLPAGRPPPGPQGFAGRPVASHWLTAQRTSV